MYLSGKACRTLACLVALGLLLAGCQGSNSSFSNPRPRSREAAGTDAELPGAGTTSSRMAIDSSGGEVEFKLCKLTVPVGALPEPLFVEISLPAEPPKDVLPESAYQISPDGLELQKEALLRIGYYDEDIPDGRDESELVIVHNVNGVWVELCNSQVHVHNNIVEAPVSYLGTYALRARDLDSRTMNTAPIAQFEFSEEPFPGMASKPFDQAKQEMEDKAKAESEAAKAAEEDAAAGEASGDKAAEPSAEGQPGDAGAAAGQGGGAATPGAGGKASSSVIERRAVGGPDEGSSSKPAEKNSNGKAGKAGKGAAAKEKDDAGAKAGNVAESKAPKKAKAKPKKQAAEDKQAEGGDEEPAEDAGTDAKTGDTTMYFDASKSSDPDGSITQYDWDFDADGVFDYTSHSSPYAQHVYTHNGDYTVVLKVSDNGRYTQAGYGTNVIRVRNPRAEPAALAAHITAYPPTGACPLTVNFGATATGGTSPYSYHWVFDDGSESKLPNPFTTYTKNGQHTVRFTVTDVAGGKLDGTVSVQSCGDGSPATPLPRILLDVSPGNVRGQAPLKAKFNLGFDRATAPVTYRILFGDEAPGVEALATTKSNVEHVYTNTGFYIMKVIATDADLRTASAFSTVYAYSPEMARDFTPSAEGVGGDTYSFGHDMHIAFDYTESSPRMVRFTAQGLPAKADKLAYQWDFGDGTYATEAKPAHTYAKDGVYEVRLTASDDVQCWRHRIWLPVSSKQPAVAIQRPPYIEGPAPLRLNFDAIVTRGEEPLRYEWNIGEARREDASTYYVFQIPGDYEVNLNVYDRNNQPMHAPKVQVRVRSGGADYRMPLAIIEPVAGSTRAALIDYNSAYPLPMSSPQLEGPAQLVDLAPDGQRIAIASDEGVMVKRTASGQPVVAFLPAAGKVVAVVALSLDMAYATVGTSAGPQTYLIRPQASPCYIGHGVALDASADGTMVLLKPSTKAAAEALSVVSVDPAAGKAGDPQSLGQAFAARLSADGRYAMLINGESRLVKHNLKDGHESFLSGGDDLKSALTISSDASACAFVSQLGDRKDIIIGRPGADGGFKLASLTDQTKLYSESFRISADGKYLMLYGSREATLALLKKARGKAVADDELNGEEAPDDASKAKQPRQQRERYGILRLDIAGAPDSWSITKVNPRFIVESASQFDYTGPFD